MELNVTPGYFLCMLKQLPLRLSEIQHEKKRIQPYEEYRNVDAFERNCVFIAVYPLTVYIF